MAGFAENLSAQGSGLCTRQAKGSPHAPEKPAPPPAVSLRVDIDSLIQSLEAKLSLAVGKDIQQAKEFPVNGPEVETNAGRKA